MQRNVLFVKLLKLVLVEFMIIYNFVEGIKKVIFWCVTLTTRGWGWSVLQPLLRVGATCITHLSLCNGYIEMHIALKRVIWFFSIYPDCWPAPRGGNPCPNFCLNISRYMLPHKNGSMLFWYHSWLLACAERGEPLPKFLFEYIKIHVAP